MADTKFESILKNLAPRILKAVIWGSLTYLVVYYLPMLFFPQDLLPFDYMTPLVQFATIAVFFAVAGQLFSGTIIGCGFGIARALAVIAFFFMYSDGGVYSMILPITQFTIKLTVDLSLFLLMIISVNLVDIAKNLLEAINLLTQEPKFDMA